MAFTPRLTKPELGNKYYLTKAAGGYSTCIKGNTKMPTYNPQLDVLPNCVGYALGRFNEIGDYKTFKYAIRGNAEDFFDNAKLLGLKTGQEPKLGAIACWSKGITHNSGDGAGHVAIVEQIYNRDTILTSESGWNGNAFWVQNRHRVNGNWGQNSTYKFLGFIYNPAVLDIPSGAKEIDFILDGKPVKAVGTNIANQNYIRIVDLQTLGIVKQVKWVKPDVIVNTK